MKTAKVFRHGISQAVRLPKEFRFDSDEVIVKHASGGALLLPKRITYEQIASILRRFKGRIVRSRPRDQKRKWK
jgi:antitoxin VapB